MQPLGPDCEDTCFIKPKTQVFYRSVATKLSKNARSPNLSLAPFTIICKPEFMLTICHSTAPLKGCIAHQGRKIIDRATFLKSF